MAAVATSSASAVAASSRTGVKPIPRGSSRADAPSNAISIRVPLSATVAPLDAITIAAPRRGANVPAAESWCSVATTTVASIGDEPPTRARKVSAFESWRIAELTESIAFSAVAIASARV